MTDDRECRCGFTFHVECSCGYVGPCRCGACHTEECRNRALVFVVTSFYHCCDDFGDPEVVGVYKTQEGAERARLTEEAKRPENDVSVEEKELMP